MVVITMPDRVEFRLRSCEQYEFDFEKWKADIITGFDRVGYDGRVMFERYRQSDNLCWHPEKQLGVLPEDPLQPEPKVFFFIVE